MSELVEGIKCLSCKETFDEEYVEGFFCGPGLCEGCFEYDLSEPAASAVFVVDGERETVRIGEFVVFSDDHGGLDVGEYDWKTRWHPTDAWRGHFGIEAPAGWTRVIDTWFCPLDGHNLVGDLARFHEVFGVQKINPEFKLAVFFPRTLNVCTTAVEVFIPEGLERAWEAYLGLAKEEEL